MDALEEIRQLYYSATKATIGRDIDRAIGLLKTLPTEEDREKVAVYMDGLSQMRSEWGGRRSGNTAKGTRSGKAKQRKKERNR